MAYKNKTLSVFKFRKHNVLNLVDSDFDRYYGMGPEESSCSSLLEMQKYAAVTDAKALSDCDLDSDEDDSHP